MRSLALTAPIVFVLSMMLAASDGRIALQAAHVCGCLLSVVIDLLVQ